MTVIKGAEESLQSGRGLDSMGPFWMGFGEVELGKRHLAHKLDVKLTLHLLKHLSWYLHLPAPPAGTPKQPGSAGAAMALPKHQTGRKRVGEYLGSPSFGVDIYFLGL